MKRVLSFIMAICMIFTTVIILPVPLSAANPTSGKCGDNLTWEYDSSTYTLTISGKGDMYDYEYSYDSPYKSYSHFNHPWYCYYKRMKTVVIEAGVTSIGRYAFQDCTSIKDVTFSNSLTAIGDSAFCGCDNLQSVIIPDSVTVIDGCSFSSCDNLKKVIIGKNCESIGNNAFNCNKNLQSVKLSDKIVNFGFDVFSYCENLNYNNYKNANYLGSDNNPYLCLIKTSSKDIESINIHKDTRFIDSGAFALCENVSSVVIPDNVLSIEYDAFSGCSNLTSVTISDSVTKMGDSVFGGCDKLTSVTFGKNLTSIGIDTFEYCEKLESIVIPENLSEIPNGTFYHCDSLKAIGIPKSIKTIGYHAFEYCSSLTDICYEGNESDFKKISIYSYNDEFKNATVNYGHSWQMSPDTDIKGFYCERCSRFESFSPELKYDFQTDSFSFENTKTDISDYSISASGLFYLNPLVQLDIACMIKGAATINGNWGGACFGFSAMNASLNSTVNPSYYIPSDYSGDKNVKAISISGAGGYSVKIKDSINIMHLAQGYLPLSNYETVTETFVNKKKKLVNVAKSIKEGDYPPIAKFSGYETHSVEKSIEDGDSVEFYDHAVLIIGIMPDNFDNDYYWITASDSNTPDYPGIFRVSKDYSEVLYTYFLYNDQTEDLEAKTSVVYIEYFITSKAMSIDYFAPGLAKDTFSMYSDTKTKSVNNNAAANANTAEEEEGEEENYISVLVSSDVTAEIKTSAGDYVITENGNITDTSIESAIAIPLADMGLTRIILPYGDYSLDISANGRFYSQISHNGSTMSVYCEKGGHATATTEKGLEFTPAVSGSEYTVSAYDYELLGDSDIAGAIVSGSSDNISLTYGNAAVNIGGDVDASVSVSLQHINEEFTNEDVETSPDDAGKTIKITADEDSFSVEYDADITLGDMNFDKKIIVSDRRILKQIILGKEASQKEFSAGDINKDSKLNAVDLNLLLKLVLGQM